MSKQSQNTAKKQDYEQQYEKDEQYGKDPNQKGANAQYSKDSFKGDQYNKGQNQAQQGKGKGAYESSEYNTQKPGQKFDSNDTYEKKYEKQQGGANFQTKNDQQYSASAGEKMGEYDVNEDRDSKKWIVRPGRSGSAAEQEKWMVECNTQSDANAYKKELMEGKIKPPSEGSKNYRSLRKQGDGRTVYSKL